MHIPEAQNPKRRWGRFIRDLVNSVEPDYKLCARLTISPPPDWWRSRHALRKAKYPDWNDFLGDTEFHDYWIAETVRLKKAYIQPAKFEIVQIGMELMEMLHPFRGHENEYTIVRGTAAQLVEVMNIEAIRAAVMWPTQKCEMVGPMYKVADVEATLKTYIKLGAPLDLLGEFSP